jgi:LppP/LprE lipoprotein
MTTQTATEQQRNGTRWGGRAWALTVAVAATALVLLARGGQPAHADGAWLNQSPPANWNRAQAAIPQASPRDEIPSCPPQARAPQSAEDSRIADAGWTLVNAFQGGYGLMVTTGANALDGMCRPLGFQTFVFFNGQYVGTLSPVLMDSRDDGTLQDVRISAPINDSPGPEGLPSLTASFARYAPGDPSCCNSSTATLTYTLVSTPIDASTTAWVLTPGAVTTTANQ